MKSFKQNQYESRRLNTLGKLEKRENSVMLTKSNINSTFSRLTDSFNTRIEYAKSRMYQQTEVLTKLKQESEQDRVDLQERIMQKCNNNFMNKFGSLINSKIILNYFCRYLNILKF